MSATDRQPSSGVTPRAAPEPRRTCIGGYRLHRRLGRGGMADVWVARREGKASTKFVAIKLIASRHAGDERYVRMFHAEAELSALLSHSNIVQVFDAGEHEGRAYLVMEWVDGPSLSKLMPAIWAIPDPVMRPRLAAYIVGQLLHALSYAHSITNHTGHELGIVHRDVSPHNVLLSVSGDVKLADFGIAHRSSDQTSGQYVKGKLRYMPREQLTADGRAPSLDLYPVGAMLHEMLDGRRFRHAAGDELQLYRAALSSEIPTLSLSIPPELEHLRVALLQPDPAYRVASADHALAMLKQWPGYVDMRLELSRLCAQMVGVARPRTGPGITSPPGRADAELSKPPPTATAEVVSERGTTATVDPPDEGAGFGVTTTSSEGRRPTEATTSSVTASAISIPDAVPEPRRPRASTARWILAGVGLVGLGFAGGWAVTVGPDVRGEGGELATSTVSGSSSESASAPPTRPTLESQPSGSERGAGPGPPTAWVSKPAPRSASAFVPELAPSAPSVPGREPPSESAPPPEFAASSGRTTQSDLGASHPRRSKRRRHRKPARASAGTGSPVMVHFRLDAIEAAQIELEGRVVTVAPRHAARLPAGRYRVRWRTHPTGRWRRAGRMRLHPGTEWVVRIGPDGPHLMDLRTAAR